MNEKKTSVDPFIKAVFLLKNLGFLVVVIILLNFCLQNTYNRVYGDNQYKNKLENLIKNGKTVIANFDDNYTINKIKIGNTYSNSFDYKYNFKINNETYENEFTSSEFIPEETNRLIKFMTVYYLPENPEINQIDAELELEYAKDIVNEHTIGMLLLNILGLIISLILMLFVILSIRQKIKDFDNPITNTLENNQSFYSNAKQNENYKTLR